MDTNMVEANPPGTVAAQASAAEAVDSVVHRSGIVPKLQNVVATVNLSCQIDLKTVAMRARNAEYNPKRFAAVIMRIREPKTTALVFASGKMVVTGAKSEDDVYQAARKYGRTLQKLEFPVQFKEFKVQNMVASCDVKFPIRLEGIAMAHEGFCSYEPELFPGLIYRVKAPKVVVLCFVSGKVVLTGAKSKADLYAAFEMMYPVLQQFRKGDVEPKPGTQPDTQLPLAIQAPAQAPLPLQGVAPHFGAPAAHLPAPNTAQ